MRRRQIRLSITATAVVTAMAGAASVSAAQPLPSLGERPASLTETGDEAISAPLAEAARQAVATGESVPVPELTSETTTVEALPDGHFSMRSSRQPVRAKDGQDWVAIDDRLTKNPDGSLSPAASAVDLTFSGGGPGPLLTMSTTEGTVSLTWPNPLPAPIVEGDSATYAEVLPGVDLSLIAGPDGYKQLLTVKNAAAAANPALDALTMQAEADGLRVAVGSDGALAATTEAGHVVMSGPQPYQWDASSGSEPAPTDESTGAGEVHPVHIAAQPADGTDAPASTTLTLTPNLAELRASDTVFPVRIDPSLSQNRLNYLTVQSGGLDYYNDSSEPMRVGKCYNVYGECTSGNGVARSFFQFDVGPISDQAVTAKIFSAKVIARQVHNASCGSTPVTLYSAGAFNSSTNYGGPLQTALQSKSSGAGNASCGNADADIAFDAAAVTSHVQNSATNDWNWVTFGLRSPDEGNWDYWKKFSNNPEIEVVFDFPPDPPVGLRALSGPTCPGVAYTRDSTPELLAKADNNNPGYTTVDLMFKVHTNTNGTPSASPVRYNPTQINVRENTLSPWSTNSSNTNSTAALPDGPYSLRVQAQSASPTNPDLGAWSAWYDFTIDTALPSAPTIGSYDYPANTWGAASDFKGTFNLSGAADTAVFAYGIDSAPPAITDTTCNYDNFSTHSGTVKATSGKAALTPGTGMAAGYHTLTVRAYDRAHNASATTTSYSFYVAPHNPAQTGATNIHRWEAESLLVENPVGTLTGATPAGTLPSYNELGLNLWSGPDKLQSHLFAPADLSSQPEFTYIVPTPAAGYYSLGLRYTKQFHYANFQVKINGQTVLKGDGTPLVVNSYNSAALTDYVDLGGHRLDGATRVTIKVVGSDPQATAQTYTGTYGNYTLNNTVARSVGIDFINAALLEGKSYTSLASAFNNDGITESATVANLGNTMTAKSLSHSALTAVGAAPGQSLTVNVAGADVNFIRPAPTAAGDNVLAMGQTIELPATTVTPGTSVHFLVAAACGSIPTAPRFNATFGVDLGAGETRYHNALLPATPDWLATPSTTLPKVTLASHYTGATVTTVTNTLYVLSATLTPESEEVGQPLTSVTLPDTGATTAKSTFCERPALHVLALSLT